MIANPSLGEMNEEPAESISCKVVQRVAEITEQEATRLPPLFETLDPDALDRLVQSAETGATSVSVQFTYAQHLVTVHADGTVSCSPKDGTPR